ncbi:MAG TPA: hypothetical protein VH333_14500 [Pseudonocardiaceae bacterium]|nr:hypothetical protein [Pseudonocardiaceae bacterium]
MATNNKWWRQPWVWIVAVPVVIVGALTASHRPAPSATTAADHSASLTITSTTMTPTTTTVALPTTTVAPLPPPPTAAAPPPAPPAAITTTATNSENLCSAPPNPLGYNYCGHGSLIRAAGPDTCSYFQCIGNWRNGKGYMEECQDGDVSMSGGRQGSCSYHGGDARPVYQG